MRYRRQRIFIGTLLTAAAAAAGVAACASNEDVDPGAGPPDTGSDTDASVPGSDAGRDSSVLDSGDGALPCSTTGWCTTRTTDPATRFDDLWPLEGAAFAADRTAGLLAFEGERWSFIHEGVSGLGVVWAAGRDEVWAGGEQGQVVHGTRSGGAWSFTTEAVSNDEPILSIWGAGADVFAASAHRIHRRAAGAAEWKTLHEETDWSSPECGDKIFSFTTIAGTSGDDVWFSGVRGGDQTWSQDSFCGYLARLVGDRYVVLADCTFEYSDNVGMCVSSPGANATLAWFDQAYVLGEGTLATAWTRGGTWLEASHDGDGGVALGEVLEARALMGSRVWGPSQNEIYAVRTQSGVEVLYHNEDIRKDGGAFAIASIALHGIPLVADLKLRGRSATDIWLFGGSYALHKIGP
ncbi:hypothetical protein AKJ09_06718 [Labilithrix luteola]|uniref:Type IV fimbrial biogenesis protein PilY1 n=1 Tax=Labilithrix luteola TaxID=1391654 RepID=A0A0K1Q3T8_9BACT|nr:hypothetical protein [Labilithrix luteola]AKV00055.1 hypothetical protein AKJ09_06718 [Labilithrix luteola]